MASAGARRVRGVLVMALTLTQAAITSAAAQVFTLNPGATVVFIASAASAIGTGSGVTTSNGFSLPANTPVTISYPAGEGDTPVPIYAITASTANLSYALTT